MPPASCQQLEGQGECAADVDEPLAVGELGHRVGDARGAAGRPVDVVDDPVGGGPLLLDRRRDGVLGIGDGAQRAADPVDGGDRLAGLLLDRADLRADVLGGLRGALGQLLDLVGHDGEASAHLARACRLDVGVEREDLALLADRGDEPDEVGDRLTGGLERGDPCVDRLRVPHRLVRDRRGAAGAGRDVADRRPQLGEGLGRRLRRLGDLAAGLGEDAGLLCGRLHAGVPLRPAGAGGWSPRAPGRRRDPPRPRDACPRERGNARLLLPVLRWACRRSMRNRIGSVRRSGHGKAARCCRREARRLHRSQSIASAVSL